MAVELSQLMQLVVGQRQFLTVGNLPYKVRSHFICNPGVVYLRHQEALHFFGRHGDVGIEDALQISLVVERGTYYLDNKRPKCSTNLSKYGNSKTVYDGNKSGKFRRGVDSYFSSHERSKDQTEI